MATRKFEFITGIETSSVPAASDPVNPEDALPFGFAEDRYVQGGKGVADITALKALVSADRQDLDIILVEAKNKMYRYDAGSAAVGDDDFIVEPTDSTGRWFKITDLDTTGSLTIPGDLTVDGTTTTINTTNLDVTDANITINDGGNAASAVGAGLNVEISDATDANILYDVALTSKFKVGEAGSESEVVTTGDAQTITGQKTIGTTTANIEFLEASSTPSTPASGYRRIFAESDGFKQVDDAGVVSALGGASGDQKLTQALDGTFTGGDCVMSRSNDSITITLKNCTWTGSLNNIPTSAGFLPTWARPEQTTRAVVYIGTDLYGRMDINSSGIINLRFQTAATGGSSQTSAAVNFSFSASYAVEV